MKRFRQLGCLLLVMLLMVLFLTGCGTKDEWEAALNAAERLDGLAEDAQLRADTEKMLNALIADDYQAAWEAICQEIDETQFQKFYAELLPVVGSIDRYELVASNINTTVRNGETSVNVRYMMTAGDLRLFVDVARMEGKTGLIAFYLTEYIPVITTGTLESMRGANGIQWILLIVGLLEIAGIICVFVDCCRHRMRKKWLWLLLIALGSLIFSVIATPDQFRINFNIGAILNYTCLRCYSTGGFTLQLVIPVGAIAYLCGRKKIFAEYETYMQKKSAQQETGAATAQMEQTMVEAEEITQNSEGEA